MSKRLGVVMDPIDSIHVKKDSTFAMLLEASQRGYEINYFEQKNLYLKNGVPFGDSRLLSVKDDHEHWFDFTGEKHGLPLADLDVVLMRKDPPFNEEYIYTTYLLEAAERLGVLVVNRPQALRDANEKMMGTWFPQCAPPTLVTQSYQHLLSFWQEHGDIVCKPLNGMGGLYVFRLKQNDINAHAVFDMLTQGGTVYIMAQRFIPEITEGDRRVIMINGEPLPHVLARIPQGDDWRGNLAVGAKGVVLPIRKEEIEIAKHVGPVLRERGIYFAGLDIIGDYLTEINITSPTCIREIDAGAGTRIAAQLFDVIEGLM